MECERADKESPWNDAYLSRGPDGVSWFESQPTTSLELIERLRVEPSSAVVDVGGGASTLVDHLVMRGFTDLTVLDISENALDQGRDRLADCMSVSRLHQDVLTWHPERRYWLWHDRALFHFLIVPRDRNRYVDVLRSCLEPNGALVVATFAEDGPEYCSGLPVDRYSPDELAGALGSAIDVVEARREIHTTPDGVVQPFTWIAARFMDRKRTDSA